MPKLSRIIEACAYNPQANILAFRHNNIRIVVEKHKIIINDIETESEARSIMDWLSSLISAKEE
jgi:ArsR family metal-binding transcriptional regulator